LTCDIGDATDVPITSGAPVVLLQQAWRNAGDRRLMPALLSCSSGNPNVAGPPSRRIDGNTRMQFLSYAYRFISNFIFLSLVYFSLNFLEKYQQRAIVAFLMLIYSAMRAASALRSFYLYQKIEGLEVEARRLAGLAGEGPAASSQRRQIVADVSALRRAGEMNSYIDLLFLALIVLLCIAKIVTD
jgi:hypothetical protein